MTNSIYIHIPFCKQKCNYCDFNSYAHKEDLVDEYLLALEKEILLCSTAHSPKSINTIYIGGGTPSILAPKQMERLFISLENNFSYINTNKLEFTLEANPGTITSEKLSVMKNYGVNRVSLGVQAFQNNILKNLGRIHSVEEVYKSIELLKKMNFDNVSIDLMSGLPYQNIKMLDESLEKFIELQIPHISVYNLIVEEGTKFYSLYENNELLLPSDDEDLEMYQLTRNKLTNAGYNQYEISNFAKKGYESKHNIIYWKNKEYYGFGAGAHGYLGNQRYENIQSIEDYIKKLNDNSLPVFNKYHVSIEEKKENMLMLGLRMLKGVKFTDYEKEFNESLLENYSKQIEKLLKLDLININNKSIKLSEKGLIYGNEVFMEFIS